MCSHLKNGRTKPLPEKSNRYNWVKEHVSNQVAVWQISEAATLAISAQGAAMPHIEGGKTQRISCSLLKWRNAE